MTNVVAKRQATKSAKEEKGGKTRAKTSTITHYNQCRQSKTNVASDISPTDMTHLPARPAAPMHTRTHTVPPEGQMPQVAELGQTLPLRIVTPFPVRSHPHPQPGASRAAQSVAPVHIIDAKLSRLPLRIMSPCSREIPPPTPTHTPQPGASRTAQSVAPVHIIDANTKACVEHTRACSLNPSHPSSYYTPQSLKVRHLLLLCGTLCRCLSLLRRCTFLLLGGILFLLLLVIYNPNKKTHREKDILFFTQNSGVMNGAMVGSNAAKLNYCKYKNFVYIVIF